MPRRSHIVIVLFTNGRRYAKVARVRRGTYVDVRARARVALSERTRVRALLETRGRVFTRASLCASGGIKEVKRTRDCHRRWV